MIIKNLKIVAENEVIDNGYIAFENGLIISIGRDYHGEAIDGRGLICMPGFVDIHIHGSCGEDFMETDVSGIKKIANALYSEGVTTFLATTLTSDFCSIDEVCKKVREAAKEIPSLAGIHLEGPFISEKYKGAQNPAYIRNPSTIELDRWIQDSGQLIKDITLAPEKEGALDFIEHASGCGVTVSAGHSDASFIDIEQALAKGLSNVTHTHNAMSGHHHRHPGIVTAAMYFDSLYAEVICDGIHVCKEAVKAFYKIVGPDRFVIITDALKAKHSDLTKFDLFGLPCVRRDGAAYLKEGPLAGSLLEMNQGVKNVALWTGADLVSLSKISSRNAAKSIHLHDRGVLSPNKKADFVLLDGDFNVIETFKEGVSVYKR